MAVAKKPSAKTRPYSYGYDRRSIMAQQKATADAAEAANLAKAGVKSEDVTSRESELEEQVKELQRRLLEAEEGTSVDNGTGGRKLFLFQDLGTGKLNGPVRRVYDNQDSKDMAIQQCRKSGYNAVIRELLPNETDALVPWKGAAPTIRANHGPVPGAAE